MVSPKANIPQTGVTQHEVPVHTHMLVPCILVQSWVLLSALLRTPRATLTAQINNKVWSKTQTRLSDWQHEHSQACLNNKYFELKTRGATAPTRTTCCRHAQVRTQQHVKTMQPHAKRMSTHSFTLAWEHSTLCINFLFFESHII